MMSITNIDRLLESGKNMKIKSVPQLWRFVGVQRHNRMFATVVDEGRGIMSQECSCQNPLLFIMELSKWIVFKVPVSIH